MSLTKDILSLQKGWALVPLAGDADNTAIATTLQAELMQLGFMFDEASFAAARRAPRDWLINYHNEITNHLRKQLGADHAYPPFYVNFPQAVMDAEAVDLFVNAVLHYWSGGVWEPPQQLWARKIAFENTEFKQLKLGTDADLKQLFATLAGINQSLTEQDKAALSWLITTYGEELELPREVPFKETLCILVSLGVDVPVKLPTDVLRIAVYMSGGDVSLPAVPKPPRQADYERITQWYRDQWKRAVEQQRDKFKFRRFSRSERRRLLSLLESTGADPSEMQSRRGRWLRLGERLHPGEFAKRFPKSAKAFAALRNQPPRVRTFNAQVNMAFAKDWRAGLQLLIKRPGELARRLDWLLRKFDRDEVLAAFERVSAGISTKVIVELYNHFAARFDANAPRVVMLKGAGSKMKTLTKLPPLPADLVQGVGNTLKRILKSRFSTRPGLGKVWIDPRLREVPVPSGMRSVNTAIRTYVRGTRVPFRADAKVIRAFIHWNDEAGGEDLDLSASLYDADLKKLSHISFTNLRDLLYRCCHSGDVRHRMGPSAEYVDITIGECVRNGVRYVVVQVYNYNGRPMYTVKDCVFGLMEREHAEANEVFVPKTITQCMPLANQSTSVAVCVLDLRAGKYIWTDIEAQRILPVVERSGKQNADVLRAMIHSTKMSVYELLAMHAETRGSLVSDVALADLKFDWQDLVTDYSRVATFM